MMGVDGFPQLQVLDIKDSQDPVVMRLTRTAEECWKQPGHSGWQILTQPIVSAVGLRWCRGWQYLVSQAAGGEAAQPGPVAVLGGCAGQCVACGWGLGGSWWLVV